MWEVGLALSLAAGGVGAIAKLLLKKRHQIIESEGAGSSKAKVVLALGLLGFIANPILDVISYKQISQTMKAPLAGTVVIFNMLFAPFIVSECPNSVDISATTLIFLGTLSFSLVGPKATPQYTYDDLISFFSRTQFVIFCVAHGLFLAVLALCIFLPRVPPTLKKAAFGAASGAVGGVVFLTKCFSTFLQMNPEEGQWQKWQTYVISLGAAASALGGIMIMNAGLRRYSACFISPLYQGLMVITGTLSGEAFFNEMVSMSRLEIGIYVFGLALILSGIALLCLQKEPVRKNAPLLGEEVNGRSSD